MRVKASDVKRLVAIFYGVSREEIEGHRRNQRVAWPRQVAMTLCRRYSSCSLPQIGKAFNRDHTTALHAMRAVERRARENAIHANDIVLLCAQIEAGAISISSAWAKAQRRAAIIIKADLDDREAVKGYEALRVYGRALSAANANFSARSSEVRSTSSKAENPGSRVLLLRGPGSFSEAA